MLFGRSSDPPQILGELKQSEPSLPGPIDRHPSSSKIVYDTAVCFLSRRLRESPLPAHLEAQSLELRRANITSDMPGRDPRLTSCCAAIGSVSGTVCSRGFRLGCTVTLAPQGIGMVVCSPTLPRFDTLWIYLPGRLPVICCTGLRSLL